MPLAAYFRNVGAALLALLLIADFYLPTSRVAQRAAAYPPVIRIQSEQKRPEPVVLDATQVVLAAATPAPWDSNPPAPPAARNLPTNRLSVSGVRDAFALLPQSHGAVSVERKKRQATRRYAARGAMRHAAPPIFLAARQGQFPWFGFRTW